MVHPARIEVGGATIKVGATIAIYGSTVYLTYAMGGITIRDLLLLDLLVI